ncbi:hypothetical protein HanPI659440_Chr12g0479681 [Helianthus annuus]|nr:hypothetical protein HanPI659440_Chr12g0479681 [Helianthus annuus]
MLFVGDCKSVLTLWGFCGGGFVDDEDGCGGGFVIVDAVVGCGESVAASWNLRRKQRICCRFVGDCRSVLTLFQWRWRWRWRVVVTVEGAGLGCTIEAVEVGYAGWWLWWEVAAGGGGGDGGRSDGGNGGWW